MKEALKILYIFFAGVGVFFVHNVWILLAIFGVHLLLYLLLPGRKKSLKFLWRVRWFVLLLFVFDAFAGPDDIVLYPFENWNLALSHSGLLSGFIMALKLFSMLTITQVVRKSMTEQEFVHGMTNLGMSTSTAEIIDKIMTIVAEEDRVKSMDKAPGAMGSGGGMGGGKGSGGGNGGGRGKGEGNKEQEESDEVNAKDVLFKGRVGNIPKKLAQRITYAKERFAGNPDAALASAALSVTLIRMVKIAPGIPWASGHKNIVLIPVFVYGIARSGKKFAGTTVGLISGILNFGMGFGKYGPIGILQFAVLGFVMDLLLLIPVRKTNLIYLALIGIIGGFVRASTDILLALMLNASELIYLVYLPTIISQVAFGGASAFISRAILKKIE